MDDESTHSVIGMIKRICYILLFLSLGLHAQVKVSGIIVDEDDNPVPFANIIFKGSTYGTISNENGKFYL